jgi:hypothetical protein
MPTATRLGKVAGTGRIKVATATEQLLYEVTDPARVPDADVAADFSASRWPMPAPTASAFAAHVEAVGPSAEGERRLPPQGYVGEGEIAYAGTNAMARARLAADIIAERLDDQLPDPRIDHRSTSLHGRALDAKGGRTSATAGRRACRLGGRGDHRRVGRCTRTGWLAAAARKLVNEQSASCRPGRSVARVDGRDDPRMGRTCRNLYELAQPVAPHKGNTSILSVIAYRPADYPLLVSASPSMRSPTICAGIVRGNNPPL